MDVYMDPSQILQMLIYGNQLKRTARTGWLQRGVSNPEDVAAHSFGVAFIALVMVEVLSLPFDLGLVLAMAVLHDLPESLTSDIPTPAWRFMPAGTKEDAEREAMKVILKDLEESNQLQRYWELMATNETDEAKLVHDCDKLDMYLQAYMYERQTGNRMLAEFWVPGFVFHFTETRAVFEELASLRNQE